MIARCYESMEKAGYITADEASVQIKLACERVIADYPDSKVDREARDILELYDVSR